MKTGATSEQCIACGGVCEHGRIHGACSAAVAAMIDSPRSGDAEYIAACALADRRKWLSGDVAKSLPGHTLYVGPDVIEHVAEEKRKRGTAVRARPSVDFNGPHQQAHGHPVIYLTNAASVAAVARGNAKAETASSVGPGIILSIMRFPRIEMGEAGVGRVLALTPPRAIAAPAISAKRATDSRTHTAHCRARLRYGDGECECGADEAVALWRAYEAELYALWEPSFEALTPGSLTYEHVATGDAETRRSWDGGEWEHAGTVLNGSTLICACSRDAAADGRCHRVIAAELLALAGWSVILDGRLI